MKLMPRHYRVLDALKAYHPNPVSSRMLPDGNGRSGCVTSVTMRQLLNEGFIKFRVCEGYSLTGAGIIAQSPSEVIK